MTPSRSDSVPGPPVATASQAVDEIVRQAKHKKGHFRLRRGFLQGWDAAGQPIHGPVADLVRARDHRGLLLFLLLATKAGRHPYNVALPAAAWARALGIDLPDSHSARSTISRAWGRLEGLNLVRRSRYGRSADVYMRREDGTDQEYTSPGAKGDLYFQVPVKLWTTGPPGGDRWYRELSLPELVVMLIGRKLGDQFLLPHEKGPAWYGISSETIERGLTRLMQRGLLARDVSYKPAPLSPTGWTEVNRYTLQPPFGPVGKVSGKKAAKRKAGAASAKKTAAKKTAAKKTAAKKTAAKKTAAKKTAAKKTAAKKTTAKKTTAKKTATATRGVERRR